MELHAVLNNIVKQNRDSILFESRLINMLTDYNAFEQYPATKYILREIIDSKYSQQLYNCTLWNMQAEKLIIEFVTKTGYQKPLSNYVFQCIAYSLGWVKTVSAPLESQNEPPKIPSVNFFNMPLYKQRAYIRSIVDIKIDFNSYNVKPYWFFDKAGDPTWDRNYKACIRVVLAIEGVLNRDMDIRYTTYDFKGNKRCRENLIVFQKSKFQGVSEVDKQIQLGVNINRLAKIEIYDCK